MTFQSGAAFLRIVTVIGHAAMSLPVSGSSTGTSYSCTVSVPSSSVSVIARSSAAEIVAFVVNVSPWVPSPTRASMDRVGGSSLMSALLALVTPRLPRDQTPVSES